MTEQEKKMWQDDIDMIAMLNERNKDLQDRMNKATQYIKNNWDGSSYTDATLQYKVAELNITELLEILESNNEYK